MMQTTTATMCGLSARWAVHYGDQQKAYEDARAAAKYAHAAMRCIASALR